MKNILSSLWGTAPPATDVENAGVSPSSLPRRAVLEKVMERQGSRERIRRLERTSSHPSALAQLSTKDLEKRLEANMKNNNAGVQRLSNDEVNQARIKALEESLSRLGLQNEGKKTAEAQLDIESRFSHTPSHLKSSSTVMLGKAMAQLAVPSQQKPATPQSSESRTTGYDSQPTNTKKLRMKSFLWIRPGSTDKKSSIFAQLLPVLAVNLGALSSGLALGYSAVLLPQLRPDNSSQLGEDDDVDKFSTRHLPFTADMEQGSWIAGIFGLGAVVGGLSSAYLGNRFGRRVSLLLLALPDLLSWVMVAAAQNLPMMLVGRFLAGVAAAGYSPNIQIFVCEIAQPVHRGWLSAITVPTLGVGTLLIYVLGSLLPWHLAAAACVPVPILLVLSLLLLWDSPYWYLHSGQDKKAHQALQMFRSKGDHDVVDEMFQIQETINHEQKSFTFTEGICKIFQDRRYYRPFFTLNILFTLMLFSGKFAIEFYAVEIFQKAGGHMNEYHSAILIAAIHLVGSLLFIPAVKRYSRKLLLAASSFVMAISLLLLGVAMYAHDGDHHGIEFLMKDEMSWLPLACVIVYMLADPIGLGSIPFIYIGEFFPSEMRSVLGSLTIALSNLTLFIVVKTFPNLESSMGDYGVYWLYASACLATLIFVLSYVPETKDKTFSQVAEKFTKIYKHYERASPWVTPCHSPATSIRKMQIKQLQFTQ